MSAPTQKLIPLPLVAQHYRMLHGEDLPCRYRSLIDFIACGQVPATRGIKSWHMTEDEVRGLRELLPKVIALRAAKPRRKHFRDPDEEAALDVIRRFLAAADDAEAAA